MGEAMKKVDHLVARAFKGAMAFVLAVGLCPVAPAMAQEEASEQTKKGHRCCCGRWRGCFHRWRCSRCDWRRRGLEGRRRAAWRRFRRVGDAAADGAGVGAPAQDAVENDGTDTAFPLTLQKRLPWPMGKPTNPTMPPPRPMAGNEAAANGWLTPKAA